VDRTLIEPDRALMRHGLKMIGSVIIFGA